jgi:hypothetical protein
MKIKVIVEGGNTRDSENSSFGSIEPRAMAKFECFVGKLETSLDVRGEHVNLERLWDETKVEFRTLRQTLDLGEPIGNLGNEFGDVSIDDAIISLVFFSPSAALVLTSPSTYAGLQEDRLLGVISRPRGSILESLVSYQSDCSLRGLHSSTDSIMS